MNRCIFLDRDGVLNKENPNYTFRVEEFEILPGVLEAISVLKDAGFLLVVVTNQSGIAQSIYTEAQMKACHEYLQQSCGAPAGFATGTGVTIHGRHSFCTAPSSCSGLKGLTTQALAPAAWPSRFFDSSDSVVSMMMGVNL